MKKINFSVLVGVIIIMSSLIGCTNSEVNKYISETRRLIEQGEYEKGLENIEKVLSKYSEDEKATVIKEMVMTYLDGKVAFEKQDYDLAKEKLDKINNKYTEYKGLKEAVEELKVNIDEAIKSRDQANSESTDKNTDTEGSGDKTITSAKAEQLVREYLTKKGEYIPSKIRVDHEEGNTYVVQCYDVVDDHTATSGWYYVNKTTGEITSVF